MSTKITQAEASQRYNNAGLIMVGIYINSKTNILTQCYCGLTFESRPESVFSGYIKSCGCLIKRKALTQKEVELRYKNNNFVRIHIP